MRKAIFTIVAKNYLPLAFVQAETIKRFHPDVEYSILLADSANNIDLSKLPHNIVTLDALAINDIESLEFKYNLTEFCTAVKPYYFSYLFNKGVDQAIYLDPDVCAFSSLGPVFNELEKSSIVVTPHFITPEINYSGTITEQLLLHVGVFNFGFVAVANTERGTHFIKWWENRLYNMAYQDKIEALHTDQKWIDLVPAFYGQELHISDDIGRNMAFWNLHERKLICESKKTYKVENRFTGDVTQLMLFHFAGFDIKNYQTVIHKNHSNFTLSNFPELKPLFEWYQKALVDNGYYDFIAYPYGFGSYENGNTVTNFQRRLYRRLEDDGNKFDAPFSVKEGSFFSFLSKNKLLSNKSIDKLKNKDVADFTGKISKLNFLMKIIKKLLGFDNYTLLLKFCMRYLRPENQTFLIKEYQKQYKFKNENQ